MKNLGTFKCDATVLDAKGMDTGINVSIEIDVSESRGLKEGRGSIVGDPTKLWKWFKDGTPLKVRTDKGDDIEVTVQEFGVDSGRAKIVTRGPVPGF